jgi:hypothetical protein
MIISLKLRIWTSNIIDATKSMRFALNIGLAEAKRLAEAAMKDYTPVYINAEQFARLYSLFYADSEISISDYTLVDSVSIPFNFSGAEVTPSKPVVKADIDAEEPVECYDPDCAVCERQDWK